ncbi:MAG: outer membrane beta-barrel protein [Bacteroidota bacterium]|nr:outer membrane beta-barrel protein [Bacteroidota bacterium]
MKRIGSILIFMLGISLISKAQFVYKLSGHISDSSKALIEGAIVSLLKANNSSLIKTVFTEADGSFEFEITKQDSFKVLVNQLGYKKYLSVVIVVDTLKRTMDLPITLMKDEGKKLEEVTVVTKLPFVERKADRTIVNPDALISSAGMTALDVLSKSPGVMVDQNGVIKLKGKSGVIVYIDDKPTYLTGSELESYLRSLPSSAIKQIELMTSPPAQYEAAGNAGIINIRTKRNKLKGINGSFSLNYGQGIYGRSTDNFNLNYNTKKLAIFSNLSYVLGTRYQDLTISRRYKNEDLSTKSIFTQNTLIRRFSEAYSARIGCDYYLNSKTTLGFTIKGLLNPASVGKYNYARVLDSAEILNSYVVADNKETSLFKNGTLNLNLRHQFDSTGKSITLDADYVSYATNINQTFNNFVDLPSVGNIYSDKQTGKLPSIIDILAFKSDYSHPLKHNAKFEAGLKSSYTKTDNDAVYDKTLNGITEVNYSLSNHFLYSEFINAAYVNYSRSFSRLDIQGGLRFESTNLVGQQLGNSVNLASDFKRDYNNLFPTLFLSYKLDSNANNVLAFSYGKRIDRAFYKDLNPFVSPLDKFTFYGGNPYLKPTFAHNLAVSYSFKSLFSTSLSYNNSIDKIQETIEINNGIYYSRPGNIGSSESYNISIEGALPIKKWLTTMFYSEVVYAEYKSKLYTETLNSKGTYWYININNSIVLKKGWSAEISADYLSDVVDSQFKFGDYGQGTIGVQKKILKDKGSLKLSVSDVLYSFKIRGVINNLYLTDANWNSKYDSRFVAATFSYRFGKNTSNKPKYNSQGSESEQKRVKAS